MPRPKLKKSLKKKPVSITLTQQEDKLLKEVGDGQRTLGIARLIDFVLENESQFLKWTQSKLR